VSLRVAVHPGAATTRVAVAGPQPRLVAERPGHVGPDAAVALLFGRPVTPTVVGQGGVPAAVAVEGATRRVVVDVERLEVSLVDGDRVVATHVAAQVVDAVVALAREQSVTEVVLVGRDPEPATLLDAARGGPVRVAGAPAVVGAVAAAGPPPPESVVDDIPPLLPVPRRRLVPVVVAGALLAVLGVVGALLVPTAAPRTGSPGQLVQYGYRFALPDGWAHTGALRARRGPAAPRRPAPDGIERTAADRPARGYAPPPDPARPPAALRPVSDGALAAGERPDGFAPRRAGGRDVHPYRQSLTGGGGVVDWTVVLDGTAQLSVGCRHGPVASPALTAACEHVVSSVGRA